MNCFYLHTSNQEHKTAFLNSNLSNRLGILFLFLESERKHSCCLLLKKKFKVFFLETQLKELQTLVNNRTRLKQRILCFKTKSFTEVTPKIVLTLMKSCNFYFPQLPEEKAETPQCAVMLFRQQH